MASIETIPCSSARGLLSKVAPTADLFMRAHDDSWLFRGQADASWGLAASAFREEEKLSRFAVRTDAAWSEWTNREQMSAEATAIITFMDESDRAGLPIPGDIEKIYQDLYLALEKPLAPSSFEDQLGWPPRSVRPVVALAQHYGIPTRLLDCSRSAYIAAYFAAADVLRNNRTGEMALWAISTTWHAPADPNYQRTYPVLIMAPYASNPNLRAQQGVHLGVPVNVESHNSASRDDFAVLLSQIDASMRPYGLTALKKFTLPAREAPQLLWYLRKHGVTGSQLFPGYAGAARSALEMHWETSE